MRSPFRKKLRKEEPVDIAENTGTFLSTSQPPSNQPTYASLRLQLGDMRNATYCVAVSPDSVQIAAGSCRGEIRIWDIRDGSGFVLKHPDYSIGYTNDISFSSDGRYLAAAIGNTVYLWVAKTGQPKSELLHEHTVSSIAFSPSGKHIACSGKDIYIWDFASKQRVHVLKGHTDFVRSLSYFAGGVSLVSSSEDGTIRMWNPDPAGAGTQKDRWKGHDGKTIWTCAISPVGKVLASGGEDRQVTLWDIDAGDWLSRPYQGHTEEVVSVSFSPDGQQIASASFENMKGEVHIRDVKTGSLVCKLENSFQCAAYTPDGKHIVTVDATDFKIVRVFALTTPATPLPVSQASATPPAVINPQSMVASSNRDHGNPL